VASIASVDDLATWLGVEITNEERAEAILAAASTLVRSKSGRAWVDASGVQLADADDDDFDIVKTIVVQVAARVWTNPHGITQETTGPYSRSTAAWAALGLSLTESEADMLPILLDSKRPALWSMRTTRAESDVPDRYLEVVGQTEDIIHVPLGEVNW
jgi:hypothetical protein